MTASYKELVLLTQQLHQAHRGAMAAELAARGLGEVGHPILLTLLQDFNEGGEGRCGTQRELAVLLNISPAAVANSLKSLERGGYIVREPRQGDARRNQVTLTDKGRRAVSGCQEAFDAVAQRMLADFTPEEREQMVAFRRRMLANLGPWIRHPSNEKEDT